MGQKIVFGEQQKIEARNQSVIGVNIVGYIAHTTVNTPFAADALVLENINVVIALNRGGVRIPIASDNLRNLMAFSVFGQALWRGFAGSQDLTAKIQLPAAGAVKEIINVPLVMTFPGIINLQGTDLLECSLNFQNSSAAATVDTAASYFYADWMDGVGVEWGIPKIEAETIQPAQNNWNKPLGSGVVDIKFFNFDKKSYLATNRVVTNCAVQSDKYKRNDTDLELQTKGQLMSYIPSSTFEPFQSFQVYTGIELNNVSVDLSLTGANVTANKNVMVWGRIEMTAQTIARARAMQAKHDRRNLASVR